MNQQLSKRLLEQALDLSPDGILILEAGADACPVVYASPAVGRLTGFPIADLVGNDADFLLGSDADEEQVARIRTAMAEEQTLTTTVTCTRKDNTTFPAEITIAPAYSRSNRLQNYLVTLKDATPRRELEERVEGQRSQLVQARLEIADLVRRDRLTGISNRKFFEEVARRDWQIAQRDSKTVSFLLFDIDHFSSYNETFGHQAGNTCLKRVARCIDSSFRRASDLIGRFGGEKFIVFVVGAEPGKLRNLAMSVCERVENLWIHHPKSAVSKYVTVSAGIVLASPDPNTTPEDLIRIAEEALTEAKLNGRNCVAERVLINGDLAALRSGT